MGIVSKSIDFYTYVSNGKYYIRTKTKGTELKRFDCKVPPYITEDTTTIHLKDIGVFEHYGKFDFQVYRKINQQDEKLLDRYGEIAPTTGNLGSSNMTEMLKTPSVVTKEYAVSYGFHDSGVGRAHQCYVYVSDSHRSWMGDMLAKDQALRIIPFSTFALPGSHDAGMYELGIPAKEIIDNAKKHNLIDGAIASVTVREVINLALTQKDTITMQLDLGTRFFDFRPGHHMWDSASELHHQHNFVPGCTLQTFLKQVKLFLSSNSEEIVVVCFSNDGFNKPAMTPEKDKITKMVNTVFNDTTITTGNFADMYKTYGQLLTEKKRFIILENNNLKSTYEADVNQTTDPQKIINQLNKLV
ncbi:MAG: hypothetical protein IAF38_14865, partial [Bacteroidia bacterium]|nr:hypothetical protein [Bacteroidia bacterium]